MVKIQILILCVLALIQLVTANTSDKDIYALEIELLEQKVNLLKQKLSLQEQQKQLLNNSDY